MAGGTTFAAALASSVHGVINGCIGLSSDPNSCHKPYQVVQVDDHHHCGIGQIFHCYTCCPLTHIPPPPVPTPSPLPTLPAPTLPSPMLPLPPPPPSPCPPEPSPPPRPPTLHMPPMILWLAFIAGMCDAAFVLRRATADVDAARPPALPHALFVVVDWLPRESCQCRPQDRGATEYSNVCVVPSGV